MMSTNPTVAHRFEIGDMKMCFDWLRITLGDRHGAEGGGNYPAFVHCEKWTVIVILEPISQRQQPHPVICLGIGHGRPLDCSRRVIRFSIPRSAIAEPVGARP